MSTLVYQVRLDNHDMNLRGQQVDDLFDEIYVAVRGALGDDDIMRLWNSLVSWAVLRATHNLQGRVLS